MADASAAAASAAPSAPDVHDAVHAALVNLPNSDRLAELQARERAIRREKAEVMTKQKLEDRKRQRLQDRLRGVGDADLFQALRHRVAPKSAAKAEGRAKAKLARTARCVADIEGRPSRCGGGGTVDAVEDEEAAIDAAEGEKRQPLFGA